jgi:hypothetical protein
MQNKLEKIANRELETMRKNCRENGVYIQERIDDYADRIRRYHFMGLNMMKHTFHLSELYKDLSAQERELKDNPRYESFGTSL